MLTSMCGSAATSAIVLYACLYACAWGGVGGVECCLVM